ncbi:hypothetical protein NDU88_002185 [Pleurodeles waltl]|uniref:Uncharacterized protein n=1 Tax=Pleurodeles waltl TaxID=8319 RepID=A0AAV7VCH7_PLEWA|nr:hypothetical protein NDU88_002185 [Pleurodeles waltl]
MQRRGQGGEKAKWPQCGLQHALHEGIGAEEGRRQDGSWCGLGGTRSKWQTPAALNGCRGCKRGGPGHRHGPKWCEPEVRGEKVLATAGVAGQWGTTEEQSGRGWPRGSGRANSLGERQ